MRFNDGGGVSMRALTVQPGQAGSAEVTNEPDPDRRDGEVLAEGIAIGVCGTDRDIVSGKYGSAPKGSERLILGHESLGRVVDAPADGKFQEGDLIVGVVRRPDPVPCGACARGHFDMCRNGRYTERGIKELHGYGSELWAVEPDYAVRIAPDLVQVGTLMEPTTVVAKAWRQIDAVGQRSWFEPKTVLVTGAGPIGLLAALIAQQRGLEVHVLDVARNGPKPSLVGQLGGSYHTDDPQKVVSALKPDVVIEATGVPDVVFAALSSTGSYGVICLTGVSPNKQSKIDGGQINRELVLENSVVVGTVNANLDDYAEAANVLANADRDWLSQLITRRVPLSRAVDALSDQDQQEIKVVIDLQKSA